MASEPWAVATYDCVFAFRYARDGLFVLTPRELYGLAYDALVGDQIPVSGTVAVYSDEGETHDYGWSIPTIAMALFPPS